MNTKLRNEERKPRIEKLSRHFKINKKAFKNIPLTYDYKGKLINLLAKHTKQSPIYDSKLKFSIRFNRAINTPRKITNYSKPSINKHIEDTEESIHTQIDIKPTYGVKYTCNKKVIYGHEYSYNPTYNQSISIKKYHELCNPTNKSFVFPDIYSDKVKDAYLMSKAEGISRSYKDFVEDEPIRRMSLVTPKTIPRIKVLITKRTQRERLKNNNKA